MSTLILTGWGENKDYACSAAAALRHFKKADVHAVSKRRLPGFLGEQKAAGYDEIVILGIGLDGDPKALEKSLKQLKKTKVTWFSALDLPESISGECAEMLHPVLDHDTYLFQNVANTYKLDCSDLGVLIENKQASEDIKALADLIDAASYAYRNYQNDAAYGNAIRLIANMTPYAKWQIAEKHLLEHFRKYGTQELVGDSEIMNDLRNKINKIAPHGNARVLILGEHGTGKEAVASHLHYKSPRQNEPFKTFNCACVTENLLESRFFGYKKGAFTGADNDYDGLFKQADGGTLFLDEIGELSLEVQGILLRVIETGCFTPMGGSEEIEVDVRLITATNRNLAQVVRDGKFRADLYHRLNVIQLRTPSLREHKDDIRKIANGFWKRFHGGWLNSKQIAALANYDYPGNVRELHNLIERAAVLNEYDFDRLLADHKAMNADLVEPVVADEYPDVLDEAVAYHIRKIVERCGGNKSQAEKILKVTRTTIRKYLKDS